MSEKPRASVYRPLERVREFFLDSGYRKHGLPPFEHASACAAMDVIEDTELAISAFLARGAVADLGERYLALYGVLQAATLQQNALIRLWMSALRQKWHVTGSMKLVRDLRDRIVGHPAPAPSQNKGMQYASFISRFSIETDTLTILKIGADNANAWTEVALSSIVRDHLDDIATELLAFADALEASERDVRAKLMQHGPLASLLPNTCDYLVSKLWEAALATPKTLNDRVPLARSAVISLQEMASAVSNGLRKRGFPPIDARHSEVLDRGLTRLGELLRRADEGDDVCLDLVAYTTLIEREFQHVRDVLSEHDNALGGSE